MAILIKLLEEEAEKVKQEADRLINEVKKGARHENYTNKRQDISTFCNKHALKITKSN